MRPFHAIALIVGSVSFAAAAFCANTAKPINDPPVPPVEMAKPSAIMEDARGFLKEDGITRELRPLTLRVGDTIHQLGHATNDGPRVHLTFTVEGAPAIATFEVDPLPPK